MRTTIRDTIMISGFWVTPSEVNYQRKKLYQQVRDPVNEQVQHILVRLLWIFQ